MTEEIDSISRQDVEEVKAALDRRFPDLKCLRCGHQTFSLRRYTDPTFFALPVPGTAKNVADLICQSCGFIETHFVPHLIEN